jgi:2-isopropylmalate synthase
LGRAYLPIDPADLGRSYEAVIRVKSQSGKGGVAWVLEQDKGLKLPKRMQADFSQHVQAHADQVGRELTAHDIWTVFEATYALVGEQPFMLVDYKEGLSVPGWDRRFIGRVRHDGEERQIEGRGNGLLSNVLDALRDGCGLNLDITDYHEHAIGHGNDAQAAAWRPVSLAEALSQRARW